MKHLRDLPHRFWPESALPPGVKHSSVMNVKSAEFKKSYTKRVNPVLKAAGFTCKSTVARRDDAKLLRMVWYGTGDAGGRGVVTIAAHFPGFPSGDRMVTADNFEVHLACFKLHLEVAPGVDWFDLGTQSEECLETAGLMADGFEEQGRAFLEHLESAEELLLGVEPDGAWLETMDDHRTTLGLHLGDTIAPDAEAAEFLARLNARAQRPERVRAFVELGRNAVREKLGAGSRPHHAFAVRFEKLLAGDLTVLDANDRAEVERRLETNR